MLSFFRRNQNAILRIAYALEKTPLRVFGSVSFAVAYKPGKRMHCFFCGNNTVSSLDRYKVPVCNKCTENVDKSVLDWYRKKEGLYPKNEFVPMNARTNRNTCQLCNVEFEVSEFFGPYGFALPLCKSCLNTLSERKDIIRDHLLYQWNEEPY